MASSSQLFDAKFRKKFLDPNYAGSAAPLTARPRTESKPQRGAALERLEMFVGSWTAEGENGATAPAAPGEQVSAKTECRWLPGGFFLEMRDDARCGEKEHRTTMIVGFDTNSNSYFAHFFDSMGYTRHYKVSVNNAVWAFSGDRERAIYAFDETGSKLFIHWEQLSKDGLHWESLCDLHATKTSSMADLIRNCFSAYTSENREVIEELLSDDFTFTSPLDDHIDKETYFELCWPNSEQVRAHHIEKVFEDGNEAFVRYELETTGGDRFHNIEFFRTEAGKIKEMQVYFGQK